MSEKEIFLEDIIEKILKGNNVTADLQTLKSLIKYQRSFAPEELEAIYQNLGGASHGTVISPKIIAKMPYPVAVLLENTNNQYNDLVRVLFLCDAVECFVRWRLATMLGVINYERGGVIPDQVLGRIRKTILLPSMGSWIGSFEHLAKQVQDSKTWGLSKLKNDVDALRAITQNRNKLAHGDIAGNVTGYLTTVKELAAGVLARYAASGIQCVLTTANSSFAADGCQLGEPIAQVVSSKAIDNRVEHFVVRAKSKTGQITVQVPCVFQVSKKHEMAKDCDVEGDFVVGSYISSHGKCTSKDDGSTLEYTVVNGAGMYSEKNIVDFISLFKTNKPLRASEPWVALLEEISQGNDVAWDFDRDVMKDCREEYITLKVSPNSMVAKGQEPSVLDAFIPRTVNIDSSRLWYFGGDAQTGKSTVLFSFLKNFNNPTKGKFVFAYRFTEKVHTSQQERQDQVDEFFFSLRDAIVFWLQRFTEVDEPNPDLNGAALCDDLCGYLELLLTNKSAAKPQILIGLDNLHCLFDPNKNMSEQFVFGDFIQQLARLGLFSVTQTRKVGFDREQRKPIVRAEQIRQVFCVATGLNIPSENVDVDDYLRQHSQVGFVYGWFHQRNCKLLSEQKSKGKAQNIKEDRRQEIQHCIDQQTGAQKGAHLPPLGAYGSKRILTSGKVNPQLAQALQKSSDSQPPSRGELYVQELLAEANGNPGFIFSIAEKLKKGLITIDDPVETGKNMLDVSSENPYFHDISALIPLLICFMARLTEPLTVTSLQMLCSNRLVVERANNKYILQALYALPRIVKKQALDEVDAEGNIAYGWSLNDAKIATSPELRHTMSIVESRLERLKQNFAHISDSIQLKEVIRKLLPPQTEAEKPSGAMFTQVYQSLRGAVPKGIRATLGNFPDNDVLRASASMLYQTNGVASAQITWLQKAWESNSLEEHADDFIQNTPSFSDFWLKHVNAEHRKIFTHQQSSISYPDKVESILSVNDDFFLVIGDKYCSISLYHVRRSRPDLVFSQKDGEQKDTKAKTCLVLQPGPNRCILVYDVGTEVHVHNVDLQSRAKIVFSTTHDYQAAIVGIEKTSNTSVVVFGKKFTLGEKKKSKIFQVDTLAQLDTQDIVSHTLQTPCGKDPKFSIVQNGKTYISFGSEAVCLSDNSISSPVSLFSTPKDRPRKTKQDIIFIGGTTKPKRTLVWFSTARQQTTKYENLAGEGAFHCNLFAENIADEYLLTVDYVGVLRLYQWGIVKPLCEVTLPIPEAVVNHKDSLKGGVLHGNRLLIYGASAFMTFFDIDQQAMLANPSAAKSYIQQVTIPQYHFGGAIINARKIEGSFLGQDDLFVTIAADNDIRLWSFSAIDCIGLLRGHSDQMKRIVQHKGLLFSADIKQNVWVWKINDGCINQKVSLPNRTPNFVQAIVSFNNQVWSVNTKSSAGAYIDVYPNNGENWSQQQALIDQQVSPHSRFLEAQAVKKVYNVSCFFVFQYDVGYKSTEKGLIAIYDMQKEKWLETLPKVDLSLLRITGMKRTGKGLLLFNNSQIYRLDDNLVLQQQVSVPETQQIKAVAYDSGKLVYMVSMVEKQLKKSRGKEEIKLVPTGVYEIYVVGEIGAAANRLLAMESTTDKADLEFPDGHLLFWFVREKRPLELYAYDSKSSRILRVPENPLLQKKPHQVKRLSQGDGFTFRSGESSFRWVLRYDYPVSENDFVEERSLTKEMIIESTSAWQYSQENPTDLIACKRRNNSNLVLQQYPVFAEVMPYGVLVHYLLPNAERAQTLVWSGSTIRGYVVANVLPQGVVVLKKNRDVIVLQLMRGAQKCEFRDLFSSVPS